MYSDMEDVYEYAMKRISAFDMPIFQPTVGCLAIRKPNKTIDKVIYEKEHCIVVDTDGNRYISRPEKGEKFDKEKGLLVALAKYCGFTTTKIQKLMEGAIDKNGKKSTKSCHCDKKVDTKSKKVVTKSTKKN